MKSVTQYERGMAEAYRLTMLARLKNDRREAELAAAKAAPQKPVFTNQPNFGAWRADFMAAGE